MRNESAVSVILGHETTLVVDDDAQGVHTLRLDRQCLNGMSLLVKTLTHRRCTYWLIGPFAESTMYFRIFISTRESLVREAMGKTY